MSEQRIGNAAAPRRQRAGRAAVHGDRRQWGRGADGVGIVVLASRGGDLVRRTRTTAVLLEMPSDGLRTGRGGARCLTKGAAVFPERRPGATRLRDGDDDARGGAAGVIGFDDPQAEPLRSAADTVSGEALTTDGKGSAAVTRVNLGARAPPRRKSPIGIPARVRSDAVRALRRNGSDGLRGTPESEMGAR